MFFYLTNRHNIKSSYEQSGLGYCSMAFSFLFLHDFIGSLFVHIVCSLFCNIAVVDEMLPYCYPELFY